MATRAELCVVRVAELRRRSQEEPAWLIENLWGMGAVGVIGGAPKSCKSWLALEMAVAIAGGQPCLGRFQVTRPGTVLVYAAEDAPPQVRERIEHIARFRGADFKQLDVHLIIEPVLRLDRGDDVQRLQTALTRYRPRLLVLDPWVRLQRVHENDATEVSAILAMLRELSRRFATAIALVHHTRKGSGEDLGQELRGSSDFHAWGDSNLYLRRRREGIVLSVEHRAAASPPPVLMALIADDGPIRLDLRDLPPLPQEMSLADRIVRVLEQRGPCHKEMLRQLLRVRNHHLAVVLRELEAAGRATHSSNGWNLAASGDLPQSGSPAPYIRNAGPLGQEDDTVP